jgi:hypothetical protein
MLISLLLSLFISVLFGLRVFLSNLAHPLAVINRTVTLPVLLLELCH